MDNTKTNVKEMLASHTAQIRKFLSCVTLRQGCLAFFFWQSVKLFLWKFSQVARVKIISITHNFLNLRFIFTKHTYNL